MQRRLVGQRAGEIGVATSVRDRSSGKAVSSLSLRTPRTRITYCVGHDVFVHGRNVVGRRDERASTGSCESDHRGAARGRSS